MRRPAVLAIVGLGLVAAVAWLLLRDDGADASRPSTLAPAERGPSSELELSAVDEAATAQPLPVSEPRASGAAAAVDGALEAAVVEDGPEDALLVGRILDNAFRPVAEATVYLVPGKTGADGRGWNLDADIPVVDLTRTTTDEQGRFELEVSAALQSDTSTPGLGASRGPFLVIVHPAFVPRRQHCDDVAPGRTDVGDLALTPGGGVRGRVVDEDGRPLAGATIEDTGRRAQGNSSGFNALMPLRFLVTETGGDGRFLLAGLETGTLRLRIQRDPFAPLQPELSVSVGSITDAGDLVLLRGSVLAGHVVDPDGAPVPGADVMVLPLIFGMQMDAIAPDSRQQMAMSWMSNGFVQRRLETDEAGRFEVRGLTGSSPTFAVWAAADGFETVRADDVAAGTLDLVVALTHPALLVLTVVADDSGEPVQPVTASARRMSSEYPSSWPDADVLTGAAAADAAGLEEAPPGLLVVRGAGPAGTELTLNAEGYATTVVEQPGVEVGGRHEAEIRLALEASVAGRVTDGDGVPIVWARLWADEDDQSTNRRRAADAVTDDEGRYRVGGLQAGDFVLTVTAPGYVDGRAGPWTLAAGEAVTDVDIVLGTSGKLAGLVSDARGRPAMGARVQAELEGGKRRSAMSNGYGRYEFDALESGRYLVTAQGFEQTVDIETGTVVELDIVLRSWAVVRGRLLGLVGPAGKAGVEAHVADSRGQFPKEEAPVNAAGEYRLELAPGDYVLVANDEDAWSVPQAVSVDFGSEHVVDLAFATGRLTGIALEADTGEPPERLSLSLQPPLGSGWRHGSADEQGRFEVDRLPPGTWRLRTFGGEHAPIERNVDIAEGRTTEVELSLLPGAVLTGRIYTADGRPPALRLTVRVRRPGSDDNIASRGVGEDSTYRLVGLPSGRLQVEVIRGDRSGVRDAYYTTEVTVDPAEPLVLDMTVDVPTLDG